MDEEKTTKQENTKCIYIIRFLHGEDFSKRKCTVGAGGWLEVKVRGRGEGNSGAATRLLVVHADMVVFG